MNRPFDVITFDCYGTLVDWDAGIGGWFEYQAARDGVSIDRGSVLDAYAAIEPRVEAGGYRPYREVLAETALEVARRFSWSLAPERAADLAQSLPDWPLFPDTARALEYLAAAGFRLGILSNVDEDLLAATRRHLPVAFDWIVTAEQVRSYKPAHGHFAAARERLGPARWLHAAQSWFHDVVPASELAIPVAWVNRKGEMRPAGPGDPRLEVPDLASLANWLEVGVPSRPQ